MKKSISIILASLLAASVVMTGCTNNSSSSSSKDEGSSSVEQSSTADDSTASTEKVTFKAWAGMHALAAKVVKDHSENEAVQKLLADYDNGRVDIVWEHPPVGMETENFNLMVSSGDLPDLIFSDFANYKGGALKAIDDGLLLDVTDLVDKNAPAFKQAFYENDELRKRIFSDDGKLLYFGAGTVPLNLETNETELLCYTGLLARKDLMDKAGFTVDSLTTVDDWEALLTSFKEQGVSPLLWAASDWDLIKPQFLGAYGVGPAYYKDGDTIKFGPIEDGYKQWIEKFTDWYKKGLIDPNFTTYKYFDNVQADMTAQNGGATGYHIYDYKMYYDAVAKDNPDKALIPVKNPVLREGDTFKFQDPNRSFSGSPIQITTACEQPEEAVKFIDYLYEKDSAIVENWGIEGKSYEMGEDGKPHYTKEYTDDETVRWKYIAEGAGIRCVSDIQTQYESYVIKEQLDAWKLWDSGNVSYDCVLPPQGLVKTAEESLEFSQIMSDVNTYVSEMTFGFIMGDKPISEWDSYIKTLKDMDIDKAIAITQATYDRYLAR